MHFSKRKLNVILFASFPCMKLLFFIDFKQLLYPGSYIFMEPQKVRLFFA